MSVYKCDLCGEEYESVSEERTAYIVTYSIFYGNAAHCCCPRCSSSIWAMMSILKQGDDFILQVTNYDVEEETK